MPEGYAGVFSPSIINIPRLAVLQSPASLKKRFKSIVSYLKPEGLKNVPQNTITESVISRTSIRLSSLPAELLLMIISHLDIVNQVCLQITCRFFRAFIIVDRVALENDRCRKWALTCFLEGDMDKYPAKVACAFCKTVRPKNQFLDFRHELGIDIVVNTGRIISRGIILSEQAMAVFRGDYERIKHRDGLYAKSFDAGTVHLLFGLMTNGRQDA